LASKTVESWCSLSALKCLDSNIVGGPFMKRISWLFLCLCLVLVSGCERSASSQESSEKHPEEAEVEVEVKLKKVVQFPAKIDPSCREGKAKVYDECSDQRTILAAALEKAKASDKALLVVYGAEWCIWCHVFDKYVAGQYARYDYQFEHTDGPYQWKMNEKVSETTKAEAQTLNHYVADNFVVAHIEGHYAPHGEDAIASTGLDTSSLNYYPVIMSVDHGGKIAEVMDAYTQVPGLEVRESGGEEYRGFQRKVLLAELRDLHAAAMPK
jgi:thioredoxin-related protein